MKQCNQQHGFTLIELMVAITIFAIMTLMAYGGMQSVFATREQTDADASRLRDIQMTFLTLQRDLEFISDREIRNQFGDTEPAFLLDADSDYPLELSRDGYRNPAQLPRSNLQRVAYQLTDKGLYRVRWHVLDRAPDSQVVKRRLIDHIDSLNIRVLDNSNTWQQSWPVATARQTFPRAIEISLTLSDWGRLSRLFILPAGNQ